MYNYMFSTMQARSICLKFGLCLYSNASCEALSEIKVPKIFTKYILRTDQFSPKVKGKVYVMYLVKFFLKLRNIISLSLSLKNSLM